VFVYIGSRTMYLGGGGSLNDALDSYDALSGVLAVGFYYCTNLPRVFSRTEGTINMRTSVQEVTPHPLQVHLQSRWVLTLFDTKLNINLR